MKQSFSTLLFSMILLAIHAQNVPKPNIIYIYADDLGYGELGSYGQSKIKTPELDRMAAEGIRFTQHYSGSPVCAPARCILLTGMHAGHSAVRANYELGTFADSAERGQFPLPASTQTLGTMLKQQGYHTALIGKWGLGMHNTEGDPLKHGFDSYYGYLDQKQAHNYYPSHLWDNGRWDTLRQPWIQIHKRLDAATATDEDFAQFKGVDYAPEKMTEKALAFLQKKHRDPFFLYLAYTLPHASLQAPDENISQYIGQFPDTPYYGQNGYASTRYPLSTYAAMISFLDTQVGIILKKLKDLGIDENTIVMFSSDNGASFEGGSNPAFFNSVGGLRGLKRDLYEGGIRVPFIARWPGKIKTGSISNHISAQYDVMPTLAELTGYTLTQTDGISFLPELSGKPYMQKKHDYLYFEFSEKSGQIAIRMGKWKGVKSDLKKNPAAPWELYNLETDPAEENDIAIHHPDILHQLNKIFSEARKPSTVAKWEFLSP
jgi:arylsulfatase A